MNFFNIGPMELIVILVLALLIFGPSRLPEVAKGFGKAINEFRRASQELTAEVTKELDTTAEALKESKETAKPPEEGTEPAEVPKEEEQSTEPAVAESAAEISSESN